MSPAAAKKDKVNDKKPASPAGSKPAGKGQLPFPLHALVAIGQAASLLTGVCVAGLSFLAGCGLFDIVIRAGSSILAVGFLFWFCAWIAAGGSLSPKEETNPISDSENSSTNLEWKA